MSRSGGGSRAVLAGACLLLCGLALLGCREEEQDRVLFFEPGTYRGAGAPALELSEGEIESLNERARTQQF